MPGSNPNLEKFVIDPATNNKGQLREAQPINAHLARMDHDSLRIIGAHLVGNEDLPKLFNLVNLSKSCAPLYTIFRLVLNKYLQQLLQQLSLAVIDDDRATVKKILDIYPRLLLVEPKEHGVPEVESQKTWQRFYTEKPLIMALLRNQVEMVKELFRYFERLKTGSAEVFAQWNLAEAGMRKQQQKQFDFQSLINVIAQENFPHGTDCTQVRLSDATENALDQFRKALLPDSAIKLADYYNIEQLLMVAFAAYENNFDQFQNWDQRSVFYVKVIGFLQGLVSPELGKIFCEGLYDLVENKKEISARTESLKLLGDVDFYRGLRSSRLGIGFGFYCDSWRDVCREALNHGAGAWFEKLCRERTSHLGRFKRARLYLPQAEPATSARRCVIS